MAEKAGRMVELDVPLDADRPDKLSWSPQPQNAPNSRIKRICRPNNVQDPIEDPLTEDEDLYLRPQNEYISDAMVVSINNVPFPARPRPIFEGQMPTTAPGFAALQKAKQSSPSAATAAIYSFNQNIMNIPKPEPEVDDSSAVEPSLSKPTVLASRSNPHIGKKFVLPLLPGLDSLPPIQEFNRDPVLAIGRRNFIPVQDRMKRIPSPMLNAAAQSAREANNNDKLDDPEVIASLLSVLGIDTGNSYENRGKSPSQHVHVNLDPAWNYNQFVARAASPSRGGQSIVSLLDQRHLQLAPMSSNASDTHGDHQQLNTFTDKMRSINSMTNRRVGFAIDEQEAPSSELTVSSFTPKHIEEQPAPTTAVDHEIRANLQTPSGFWRSSESRVSDPESEESTNLHRSDETELPASGLRIPGSAKADSAIKSREGAHNSQSAQKSNINDSTNHQNSFEHDPSFKSTVQHDVDQRSVDKAAFDENQAAAQDAELNENSKAESDQLPFGSGPIRQPNHPLDSSDATGGISVINVGQSLFIGERPSGLSDGLVLTDFAFKPFRPSQMSLPGSVAPSRRASQIPEYQPLVVTGESMLDAKRSSQVLPSRSIFRSSANSGHEDSRPSQVGKRGAHSPILEENSQKEKKTHNGSDSNAALAAVAEANKLPASSDFNDANRGISVNEEPDISEGADGQRLESVQGNEENGETQAHGSSSDAKTQRRSTSQDTDGMNPIDDEHGTGEGTNSHSDERSSADDAKLLTDGASGQVGDVFNADSLQNKSRNSVSKPQPSSQSSYASLKRTSVLLGDDTAGSRPSMHHSAVLRRSSSDSDLHFNSAMARRTGKGSLSGVPEDKPAGVHASANVDELQKMLQDLANLSSLDQQLEFISIANQMNLNERSFSKTDRRSSLDAAGNLPYVAKCSHCFPVRVGGGYTLYGITGPDGRCIKCGELLAGDLNDFKKLLDPPPPKRPSEPRPVQPEPAKEPKPKRQSKPTPPAPIPRARTPVSTPPSVVDHKPKPLPPILSKSKDPPPMLDPPVQAPPTPPKQRFLTREPPAKLPAIPHKDPVKPEEPAEKPPRRVLAPIKVPEKEPAVVEPSIVASTPPRTPSPPETRVELSPPPPRQSLEIPPQTTFNPVENPLLQDLDSNPLNQRSTHKLREREPAVEVKQPDPPKQPDPAPEAPQYSVKKVKKRKSKTNVQAPPVVVLEPEPVDEGPVIEITVHREEEAPPTILEIPPPASPDHSTPMPLAEKQRKPAARRIRKANQSASKSSVSQLMDLSMFPFLDDGKSSNFMFTWLSQFAILTDAKRAQFQRVFDFFDTDHDSQLSPDELAKALQVINANLITPKQTEYVMSILTLVMETQRPIPDKLVKFPLFGIIAALSERIVALDEVVTRHLNKMDFAALKAKLIKARDMFIVCDTHGTGIITLDALRIELKAGRISQEHEDEAIMQLEQENKQELTFLDFLVYLPLFLNIHSDVVNYPLQNSRFR